MAAAAAAASAAAAPAVAAPAAAEDEPTGPQQRGRHSTGQYVYWVTQVYHSEELRDMYVLCAFWLSGHWAIVE